MSEVAFAQLEQHPWWAPRYVIQHWLPANSTGWSAHDLRRTFSTRHNAMGVPPYVVEKMLNHTFSGVMGVYNHATYDAERRQALEAWSIWQVGVEASRKLLELVTGHEVVCEDRGHDRYGRMIGLCRADGVDIQAAMVRAGMAWAFVKYSRDYVQQEAEAKTDRLGVHEHGCEPPWEWRPANLGASRK